MNKKTLLTGFLLFCVLIVAQAQNIEKKEFSNPSKNEYLYKQPIYYLSVGSGVQFYLGEDDAKASLGKRFVYMPSISIGRRFGNLFGIRGQFAAGTLVGYNNGESGFYTKWAGRGTDQYDPEKVTWDPQWDYMGWTEANGDFSYKEANGKFGWTASQAHQDELYKQHFKYISAAGDVTLNLSHLLNGYNPNRRFELIPFVGATIYQRFAGEGRKKGTFFGAHVGLTTSYNFSGPFSVFAEFKGAIMPDSFDGQLGALSSNGIMSTIAGITYRFGQPKYIDPALETRLNLPTNIAKAKDKMVLVPGGNIELGAGMDPIWGDSIAKKLVAVSPFWMDETEVTNREYREFVYSVRDSIIRERLADLAFGGDPTFKVLVRPTTSGGESAVAQRLNWKKPIPWKNPTEREALAIASVIGGNPFDVNESGLNTSTLNFKYTFFDAKAYYATLAKIKDEGTQTIEISKDTAYVTRRGDIVRETLIKQFQGEKSDFVNTYIVNVYPDVLSWMTDFANAKNEQYVKYYFTSNTFDNFPVIGASWEQADAYCAWRTNLFKANNQGKTAGFEAYRLPTEAEWEFAARNGRSEMIYPFYATETHDANDLANSNFRESRDLKDLVSPVATFLPNRFGLYDMAGNVAEWTTTLYTETADKMAGLVNPDYSYRSVLSDPDVLKRKMVKGGSWKDSENFIRSDVRSFEMQTKGRSYIGFRCVRSWGIDNKGLLK